MEHEKWWTSETAKCHGCGSVVVTYKVWKIGRNVEIKVIEMEMKTETPPDYFLCDTCYETAMNEIEWELYGFEYAEKVSA
jgi:hypothetical protein